MRFQAPRGTEDVLPGDSSRWLQLEKVFRELTSLYGYQELRTPTFEDTALFLRTAGETSDIVTKEMYTFTDKGDRSVTLKPEGTAPAMRAVIEHNLCPPGTVTRLSYVTPCFRYNRPGKGRLRELHQFGLELIGSPSASADAEIIEVTYRFFRSLGLTGMRVLINSIGRDVCRTEYREVILSHLKAYLTDQTTEFREQAEKNPLRLLDTKDSNLRAALEGLPPITESLEQESKERFDRLQSLLTDADVPFEARPEIVRGLDYYTETVFEILHPALGDSSICGGGRYDNLVKELGGSPTPSVGVGIGVERTLLAVAGEGIALNQEKPTAFVVQASAATFDACQKLARELRANGVSTLTDIDGRSFKSQLRQADKSGAAYALVIGEDELAKNTVQLKNLASGEQSEVPLGEIVGKVTAEK